MADSARIEGAASTWILWEITKTDVNNKNRNEESFDIISFTVTIVRAFRIIARTGTKFSSRHCARNALSRHTREIVHKLDFNIRETGNILNREIREILHKFPFADLVREILHGFNF